MRRRAVLLLTATVAMLLLVGGMASAQTNPQGNLDANCQVGTTQTSLFNRDQKAAQTFTAANSGKLTSAQVKIWKESAQGSGDYVLKIATVNGSGVPTTNVLASATIPNSSVPNGEQTITANFDSASAATVVAGQQYALIVERGNNDSFLVLYYRDDNPCPGGSVYWSTAGGPFFQIDGNRDLIYATYVTDNMAPTVESVSPADGSAKVSRLTNVSATFSEEMDPSTLGASTVTLKNTKTGQTVTDVGVTPTENSEGKTVLTLDPFPSNAAKKLAKKTKYEVRIKGGSGGAADETGNVLTQDAVWSFTTGRK